MVKRIVISFVFIPLLILIIHYDYLYGISFFLFIFLLSILLSWELYGIFKRIFNFGDKSYLILWFIFPNVLLYILYYINLSFRIHYLNLFFINIYIMILILVGSLVITKYKKIYTRLTLFLFSYIYTGFMPFIIYLLKLEHGNLYVYLLFILGWISDASAYFIGSFFGKTRGIVRYSPNKSLEGYAGSFIFTILISICFKLIFYSSFPLNIVCTLSLGILVSILAPFGDILESVIKRKANIKDSSKILHPFGGVLDIFDSIVFSSLFYYILVKILS